MLLQKASDIKNRNDVSQYLSFILEVPEHPVPVYDSQSFNKFNKVLNSNLDFVLFNNGTRTMQAQIPTLWTIEDFRGDYLEFSKFIDDRRDYVYCYRLQEVEEILRLVSYDWDEINLIENSFTYQSGSSSHFF